MYVVKYQGADQLLSDGTGLAGCLSYYADPVDALANHKYVSKLVVWLHDSDYDGPPGDYLGKPYRIATSEEARHA